MLFAMALKIWRVGISFHSAYRVAKHVAGTFNSLALCGAPGSGVLSAIDTLGFHGPGQTAAHVAPAFHRSYHHGSGPKPSRMSSGFGLERQAPQPHLALQVATEIVADLSNSTCFWA